MKPAFVEYSGAGPRDDGPGPLLRRKLLVDSETLCRVADDWWSRGVATAALGLSGWQFLDSRRNRRPSLTLSDARYVSAESDNAYGDGHAELVQASINTATAVTIESAWLEQKNARRRIEVGASFRRPGTGMPLRLPVTMADASQIWLTASKPNAAARWIPPGAVVTMVIRTSTGHVYKSQPVTVPVGSPRS